MKTLRKLHLYLGCIFAPMLILFAGTGAVQMFGMKIPVLFEAHTRGYGSIPFMFLSLFAGLSVVVTSILGVVMALRMENDRKRVWACLLFGTLLPAILLIIVHWKQSR